MLIGALMVNFSEAVKSRESCVNKDGRTGGSRGHGICISFFNQPALHRIKIFSFDFFSDHAVPGQAIIDDTRLIACELRIRIYHGHRVIIIKLLASVRRFANEQFLAL